MRQPLYALGLAHRNAGHVARTTAVFEVVFRVMMTMIMMMMMMMMMMMLMDDDVDG